MIAPPDTAAVLLAGGLARRMGGGDKGLRLLGGRPLLDHVIERVRPQVRHLALNANGDPARFAAWGLPVISDPETARGLGPLSGILAGMRWAATLTPAATMLLSVPVDAPFLPADLVARLSAAVTPRQPIACAGSDGRRHPVAALWPVELHKALAAALADGSRGVATFAEQHGLAVVAFAAGTLDPFTNINDPEGLSAAERAVTGS